MFIHKIIHTKGRWTLLVMVFLVSCDTNKVYYYKQDSKEEEKIEAKSDQDAYLAAYQKFIISQKVYDDMKATFGASNVRSMPIAFKLLNSKHEDITYSVSFPKKDSLENDIKRRIYDLPNDIAATSQRLREEKHGSGAKYDTGGLYLAPVKVLSARFTKKDYSTYRDVSLRYKNVSDKTITAIRFKWYGENSFGEPADMSGLIDGWGGGFTEDVLRPGASDYGTWSVLSRDGKKILIAYPYEVVFKDGTKWELEK